MDGRHLVAERGLVAAAVTTLTTHAFTELPVEAVGATKALLKRFFSTQDWGPDDDEALAAAVGPGQGWWAEPLDGELTLEFGWCGSRFRLRIAGGDEQGANPATRPAVGALEATFEGPIVPEATPNPRTLAFRTGPLHDGDSRLYRAGAPAEGDPRVARLFEAFPDLATVLVARDFVALTVRRPDRWEALLAPVLQVVTEEFAGSDPPATSTPSGSGGPAVLAAGPGGAATVSGGPVPRETRLDRAWRALGGLRAADPVDLDRILAASRSPDAAFRQVAAGLVKEAPLEVARLTWELLGGDASRVVRRAAVDAMVDTGNAELRPLLERALSDGDGWVRWKALRGLTELGPAPSHSFIQPLADDPDFRVRLEAQAALRPWT